MDLPDILESELAEQYPTRLPVWWARHGVVSTHPVGKGISGRRIILRYPKKFGKIESIVQRLLRGPKSIRRPLDQMNSLLWELCDGSRTFGQICELLDQTFHEDIAPVVKRTATAIHQFQELGLMIMLARPEDKVWEIGPGIIPKGHEDNEVIPDDYDTSPLVDG
ncbi:MAG: PqqD family protein [Candidatus Poseidoniaceae archaeon]|jgi:hypothetical protein|nr:PqqD family protein [Candidatus Poseidoniaceae archaeon]